MKDPLEPTALAHATACGFELPKVLGVCRDLAAPGTVAFWVGDQSNRDALLGVLINDNVGVIEEFDSHDYQVGVLPAGGLKHFFTTEDDHV
jgi:hypothetical protein